MTHTIRDAIKTVAICLALSVTTSCTAQTRISSRGVGGSAQGDCRIVAISRSSQASNDISIESACFDGSASKILSRRGKVYSAAFIIYVANHKVFYEKGLASDTIVGCLDLLKSIYEMDPSSLRRISGKALPDYSKDFLSNQKSIRMFAEGKKTICAFILEGAAIKIYLSGQGVPVAEYLEY